MAFPANATDALVARVEINFGRDNVSKTIYSGGETTVTVDNQILRWINDTMRNFQRRANFWFCHTTGQTATLTSGTGTFALQSDHMDLDDPVWYLDSATNTFVELDQMSLIDYRRDHDDTTTGSPSDYMVDGSNVLIRPIADQNYTMYYDYWKYLADLTAAGSSNTIVDKFPLVLEYGATSMAFNSLEQFDNGQFWGKMYEMQVKEAIAYNADRELPDTLELYGTPNTKGTKTSKIAGR